MKVFYGWRMVGAAFGIQFLIAALMAQAFGLYVAIMATDLGWSKTALAGAAALQSVESTLTGPALGYLVDRFGPRRLIRLGVLCMSAGLMLLSQVQSIGVFYVCAVMMSLGASLSGYFPLSISLMHWFDRHRARALSMMTLGLAFGGLTVPLNAYVMQHWGWRSSALGSGLLVLLIGLPLAGIMRHKPQHHGEHPDGIAQTPHNAETGPSAPSQVQFTLAQAVRTRTFWLISLGHGLALMVVSAVSVHAVTHLKEGLGLSVTAASGFIMLMTLGQLGGVLLGVLIGSRLEKRKVAAVCMLLHALGLLCLTWATGPVMLWGFALFHGVAWGLRGPYMQALRADYFGTRAIGQIMGISTILVALGQMTGPLLAGWMADATGNYHLGLSLLALLAALGSVLFLWARPPHPPAARSS